MSHGFQSSLSRSSTSFMEPMESPPFLLDSLIDYLQYPTNPLSLPESSSSLCPSNTSSSLMDFYHAPLSSLADYDYASAALPSRRGAPLENASISVPTLTYSTGNTATLSNEQHLDRRSFSSNPSPSVPKSYRFNPISAPTARSSASVASKRINSKTSNDISDEGEEEEYAQSAGSVDPLQEAVRRQRIESEQKRRDDLRDGYTHLKSMLPSTNQKSSKVKLLNRAARHIKYLNAVRDQLETELETANNELNAYRLREANEAHGWHHYSSY